MRCRRVEISLADWMADDEAEEREREDNETHGAFQPSAPSHHQFSLADHRALVAKMLRDLYDLLRLVASIRTRLAYEMNHRIVESNGIKMHLAEDGEGPLVVLCHGLPELWYSWRHQLKALAPRRAMYHRTSAGVFCSTSRKRFSTASPGQRKTGISQRLALATTQSRIMFSH